MVTTAPSTRPAKSLTLTGYYGFVLLGWNAVLVPSLIRSIEHDFRRSDAAFGLFYLISSLCYTVGAFGCGLLVERSGRRMILSLAALALAAGLIGLGLAPAWGLLLAATVIVGWGGGMIDAGINGLFLDLYREARGGALNLLHLFFGVGALVAPFVIGLLVTAQVNWRLIVLASALAFFSLTVLLGRSRIPSGRQERTQTSTQGGPITRAEQSLWPFAGLALSIGLYVAAEMGVSGWVVRLLSGVPEATATAVLSLFWGGLAAGRLLSNWVAERIDYYLFTIGCLLLSSLALIAATLSASLPLAAILFALTGFFYGPVYPMIMALGGNIYPHRLSLLSSGLAGAAVTGSIVYPPLMGFMAAAIGLRGGMVGAALLGIPAALGIVIARNRRQ